MILGVATPLLVAIAGCAASPRGTPIGMSDAVPEHAPPAAVAVARVTWVDFAVARAWPEAAPAAPALAHRRDGTLIHVRVEPNALPAYRELSAEVGMPDGARVVAWHEAPSGDLLGGYLLEKRAGAWSAREIDAHGALVPGDHTACLRCHDMAPTDHLFGPRSAPPAVPAAVNGESIDPQRR